ncbi:DUF1611 domain-containing protein [Vibrio breoganii]|uniref:DUF1611 domain-containing protein n=1 Tax=Vibrio breoganii TaxID=553239 RepID=UPI001300F48C|nr:DUF1611 domain-containing protein [Vibrio breoganii]
MDAGYVLDDECNGIPVCASLNESIDTAGGITGYFIFGLAPSSSMYSESEKSLILEAMRLGMNIKIIRFFFSDNTLVILSTHGALFRFLNGFETLSPQKRPINQKNDNY